MHRHQLADLTLRPRSHRQASPGSLRTQSRLPDLNALWDSQADDDAESGDDLDESEETDGDERAGELLGLQRHGHHREHRAEVGDHTGGERRRGVCGRVPGFR